MYRYPYPYPYSSPQPYPYFHPPYHQNCRDRQYPGVDETMFIHSVEEFKKITSEASTILAQLSNHNFARQLMTAAQQGNQQEVDRLMNSIGVSSPIAVKFTPTGIELKIHAAVQGSECCSLTMFLRWGN